MKKRKDRNAQAMVRKRNMKLSPERRSEIARAGAVARWKKSAAFQKP